MKKRILSMLLVLVLALALFPTAAFAASSEEEALGEINIFDGGTELSYLSINGRVRDLIYTYYNYTDSGGRRIHQVSGRGEDFRPQSPGHRR